MSITTTYPFTTAGNYTLVDTEVSGGAGRLDLQVETGQTLQETFTSDAGFTYNASLVEFASGLVRQLDQTPSNSVYAAKYASTADLSWHKSGGSTTGTLNGAPTISGGKLVCTGSQGVYYVANTNTVESHKFKYTPNYSGTPVANLNTLTCWNGTNNNDRVVLFHSDISGTWRLTAADSTGVAVVADATIMGASWSPTASQEYEIEFVIDSVSGTYRLFIDGTLHATLSPGAWTRGTSASRYYMGASTAIVSYNRAEGSFDDYIKFSNAQHTTSYTPGYTLVDTIYAEAEITIPTKTYPDAGTIQRLESTWAATEVGTPRYTINDIYHNGSNWTSVTSAGYAQANTIAQINTFANAYGIVGQDDLDIKLYFPDSNTQHSVDILTMGFQGQEYPTEGTLLTNSSFVAREITSFTATTTTPANTTVKYIMNLNGTDKYHNGSAWVTSDGTNSQANTLAEVQTNLSTLLTENSTVKIKVVLAQTDEDITPEIDLITLVYDFGALEPAAPTQCQVYGFLVDSEDSPLANATVTVTPNRDAPEYKEAASRLIGSAVSKTTDVNGFFSMNLIISSDYETDASNPMVYVLEITLSGESTPISLNGGAGTTITFTVPNQATLNITENIGAL